MRRVGLAFDPVLLDADAVGGAVATLGALRRGPVDLDELRVVDVGAESAFDSFKVGAMAVAR